MGWKRRWRRIPIWIMEMNGLSSAMDCGLRMCTVSGIRYKCIKLMIVESEPISMTLGA